MHRSYTNQDHYLPCHTSGQLLNWVRNKRARIHLIGRGTHPSSIIYAKLPRDLFNTSMFVEPWTRRANRGVEVGRSRVIGAAPCFDILSIRSFYSEVKGRSPKLCRRPSCSAFVTGPSDSRSRVSMVHVWYINPHVRSKFVNTHVHRPPWSEPRCGTSARPPIPASVNHNGS